MTDSVIKILIDENISRPWTTKLREYLSNYPERPEIEHVIDFQRRHGCSQEDEIWIPKAAKEKWILITADRARRCGGEKLPLLCIQYKLTHILMSSRIQAETQQERSRVIITLWQKIAALTLEPPGTRRRLIYNKQQMPLLIE